MRYIMTAFAALSLGALPLTAQVPARPAQPTQPAQPAAPPAQLTEQQRQQHQAIREKYAKEFKAHQDAMQALNEKMRSEIEATLTPEQRAARQRAGGRGLGLGGGRGVGLGMGGGRGVGLAQGGGRMGGMAPGDGQLQRRAMMWNRADRAARQIIGMRNRVALRTMMHPRRAGAMGRPGMMGQVGQGDMVGRMGQGTGMGPMRRGAMMGGVAPAQPAPKVVKPAPSKAPPAPPAPAKKPTTGGGGD